MADFKPGDEVRARWPSWGRGPDKTGEPTTIVRVLKTRIECADGTRWQPNGFDTYPMRGGGNYAPRIELMSAVRRRQLADQLRALDGRIRSLPDAEVKRLLDLLPGERSDSSEGGRG
jgi:hypothetical protein